MNSLFNNILANTSSDITVTAAIVTMLAAVALGAIIAYTYYFTQEDNFQRSMAITLLMLPIILSVIILFIRFRSAPGDPKDIGFIFFDIAAGLACGVGLYGYGAIFVILLCLIIIIAEKCNLFSGTTKARHLKITIPEDLNYHGAFDEILKKYTKKY